MKKFIITLTKSKFSTDLANQRIAQAKEVGIGDIEIFPATDKYDVWQRWYDEGLFIKNFAMGGGYLSSELATFFSHYDLWKKCLELNENILILEHDVFFKYNPNLEQFNFFGGDVINLGYPAWGTNNNKPNENYWKYLPTGLRLRPEAKEEHSDQQWLFGAYSYILTPNGAKKLRYDAHRNGIIPADRFISQTKVDIHDYLPHPVIHKNENSFIQKRETNEWDY
jgi:GR25 family glycosyltransferase involved in LPS biosynthesis